MEKKKQRMQVKGNGNSLGTKKLIVKNNVLNQNFNIQDNFNIMFHNEKGDVIGKIFVENDIMKFEGEADESAKVFFDSVISKYLYETKNL